VLKSGGALDPATGFGFDVMMLDIGLPVCNGYDITRKLRESENTYPTRSRVLAKTLLHANRYDEVVRGSIADVFQAVQDAGRGEDDAARFDQAVLEVTCDLQSAIADQEKLGVRMAVRWVRHLAGRERGLVHFDILARSEIAVDHRPGLAAVRGRLWRERVERKEPGMNQLWFSGSGVRFGLGFERLGQGCQTAQSGQGETKIATVSDIRRQGRFSFLH
jgi:hypothetical protein